MAEVAAGVIAVEQVVSTGLEVGAAATVARPTQPLTAVLSQIATTPKEDNSLSLARSHHSVSVIDGRAYIFGGKKDDGQLCNNDIHAVSIGDHQGDGEYACYPAVGDEGQIPSPRINHASCTRRGTLIIHGGQNSEDEPVDDEFTLWEWEPKAARWSSITAAGKAPQSRDGHQIFYDVKKDSLILHGGYENDQRTKTTWLFDFTTRLWHPLPDAPAEPLAAQFVEGTLYSISAESDVHGSVHYIKPGSIQDESLDTLPEWTTVDFPSNPLVPGPRPRVGSALIPVTTGHGRRYLLYLLGSRQDASISSDKAYTEEHPFYSDMWTLQLPSDGYSATRVKDAIRETIPGVQSGAFSWHELEIAPAEMTQEAGKVHPGPRGFFGADGMKRALITSSIRANATRSAFHTIAPRASPNAPNAAKPQPSQAQPRTTDESSKEASTTKMAPRKKTSAELDQELREKLEGMSGEGGGAGVEYENGRAEGLKRGVKSNMFRVI
ncbi:Tip elongation aberrant protein 3 [Fusarium oxysporum f. sp. phaseoli]